MDKSVVLAVAGSGKTSAIIDDIESDSRSIIITYTENNTRQIKKRIIEKHGGIPSGVRVYSYFTFLYSFCFRPLCGHEVKVKGINFDYPLPLYAQRTRKNSIKHYIDRNDRLYANRIAKWCIEFDVVADISERLVKFFDKLYIDEIQDFAANDFNLICALAQTEMNILLLGDFFQHTFDTSRDGNTQRALFDCYEKYREKFEKAGFEIDLIRLSNSYRCSPSICSFIEEKLGINIQSHREDDVEIGLIENQEEIDRLYEDESVVKLFYQRSSSYSACCENWGNTKGLDDYNDVCVVLNQNSLNAFKAGKLAELPPTTKNKLYVACTRAKGNLYFIAESTIANYRRD